MTKPCVCVYICHKNKGCRTTCAGPFDSRLKAHEYIQDYVTPAGPTSAIGYSRKIVVGKCPKR